MTPEQKRARAARACMERFEGKAFEIGKRDCVKLAAHALHVMGVKVAPLKGVRYSTLAGAVRAMRQTGFADLVEAMDALGLTRIAPARATAGDIVALPTGADCPFGCSLTVAIGNGAVLGFHETTGVGCAIRPKAYLAAWRAV